MTAPNEATARQIEAARPGASTWLSANAGSGKTRVLTDRVARLLLNGAAPQNILCLTYTKAAASEMQNRLFKRLGEWAMTPDGPLRAQLRDLGVEDGIDGARLALARTLFARAIETPGGLKIQTIHSFCASLLRRFPLEARVSPQFQEMDERAQRLLTDEIVEELADTTAPDVIAELARHYTGEDFSKLTDEVCRQRDRLLPGPSTAEVRAGFDLPEGLDAQGVLDRVFLGSEAALLARIIPLMEAGKVTDQKAAAALASVSAPFGLEDLAVLESVLLSGAKAKVPFAAKIGALPTKALRETLGADGDALDQLMGRVEDTRALHLGLLAAKRSIALHRFAQVFLPLYQAKKLARGWLDFEDLILKARDLMTDPAVAQWVLYRLDGGIDHVLVDEAQDTSPTQWRVIDLLTQEFSAGDGVQRAEDRSLFVVGDRKQSIYSFQGAEPEAFERMFDHFQARMAATAPLHQLELQHSFRSSHGILHAVDAVFGGNGDAPTDVGSTHRAFHEGMPGRVDLWPLVQTEESVEDTEWFDPVDRPGPGAADVALAQMIAAEIRRMIDASETVPAQNGTRRPVTEGDFLILVQRRNRLFNEIIRACKQQRLAIAGADRLKLGAELAVRDLRALLAFLATPEDDLSLASALRSPLFGWDEGALFDLAAGRPGYLWEALRDKRDRYPETMTMIDALRKEADFLRPYDLLERILLRHHGRARLLGRLGDEAQDGLDELLSQALNYEQTDVPSLTGFLTWLDAEDVVVKRQADGAGRRIRVMSVHGAKGLEAPIVILPDTLRPKKSVGAQLLPVPDGPLMWRPLAENLPPVLAESLAKLNSDDDAERARLLYVAMTRAESWLIICGAGKPVKNVWYATVETAMDRLETVVCDFPTGPGLRFGHGDWQGGPLIAADTPDPAPTALPGWIATNAATPVELPEPIRPSDMGGAKATPGQGGDRDAAMARGTALHRLLEHLPDHPEAEWPHLAQSLIGEDASGILASAHRVMTNPDTRQIFTEGLAEVEIVGTLDALNGRAVVGTIDRLIVADDHILAVDFKSNTDIPATPDAVPEGILRQMGAYAVALQQIWPDRRVETAILWTEAPQLMPLPDNIVREAWKRATRS